MARPNRVPIESIQTGVPGLDVVLGGGIPVYSTTMLVGPPGVGKTTLAHQIVYNNAGDETKALYFAALGEPAAKMLRYQQQFDFFDQASSTPPIIYREIGDMAHREGLSRTLEFIAEQVAAIGPGARHRRLVPRTRRRRARPGRERLWLRPRRERDARYLEHDDAAARRVLLPGDAVASRSSRPRTASSSWTARPIGNATLRKLEAVKMRGHATLPGRHTFRISHGWPRGVPSDAAARRACVGAAAEAGPRGVRGERPRLDARRRDTEGRDRPGRGQLRHWQDAAGAALHRGRRAARASRA